MTSRIVTAGGSHILIGGSGTFLSVVGDVTPPSSSDGRDEPSYTIDLCVNWTRIGEAITCSFDGVIRHLAPGEWTLTGHVDGVELQAGFTLADVDTIRVVDDAVGRVVFGGYVATVASGVGGLVIVSNGNGSTFTMKGPDLWLPLQSRLAYPTPSTEAPWATGHDERTGVASTVATGYISDNVGPSALTARRVPMTITDGLVGTSGTWSARLQPLSDLVARVCADGAITCRATVGFDGGITYTLTKPRDRTATGVLSDQGDLTNVQTSNLPATATYVIAGGQGDLEARTFATIGTAAGIARREVFSDQSSLTTPAEVAQAAATALAAGAATIGVRSDITPVAAQRMVFIDDYDIGDILAVEIDSIRYPVAVSSVAIHIGPTRSVALPSFAPAATSPVTGILRDIADLQSRFQTQIA